MDIFCDDEERYQYLQFVKEETKRSEMDILAWCLMTNHVHFIVVPNNETSLARGFGEAHKRYTRMKNFKDNVRGYLFQGRFSSCVLDERHLLAAVRYVENNPVEAGMAGYAWEYQWSSAAYHVGDIDEDVLLKSRDLYGLVRDWREYLLDTDKSKDALSCVMRSTRTGRPAGSHDFVKNIEKLIGRPLQKQKSGPKKKIGNN
ncbi:MAG: transposase [Syntrophales bacterium]